MRICLKNGYLFESSLKIFNPSIANRSERGEFGVSGFLAKFLIMYESNRCDGKLERVGVANEKETGHHAELFTAWCHLYFT